MIKMEEFPDVEEGTQDGLFNPFLYVIDECNRKHTCFLPLLKTISRFENCREGGVTALLIYCILPHANSFHFFKFTRESNSEKTKFQPGWVGVRGPGTRYQGLSFPTPDWSGPQTYFILHLRYIAKTIFNHMLDGYICSLEATTVGARST